MDFTTTPTIARLIICASGEARPRVIVQRGSFSTPSSKPATILWIFLVNRDVLWKAPLQEMKKKQIRLLTLSNKKINPSNRKVCQLFSLIYVIFISVLDVNTYHHVEKRCCLDDFDRDVNWRQWLMTDEILVLLFSFSEFIIDQSCIQCHIRLIMKPVLWNSC